MYKPWPPHVGGWGLPSRSLGRQRYSVPGLAVRSFISPLGLILWRSTSPRGKFITTTLTVPGVNELSWIGCYRLTRLRRRRSKRGVRDTASPSNRWRMVPSSFSFKWGRANEDHRDRHRHQRGHSAADKGFYGFILP